MTDLAGVTDTAGYETPKDAEFCNIWQNRRGRLRYRHQAGACLWKVLLKCATLNTLAYIGKYIKYKNH